jgi:tetratricopeptide (TPR) repeat protein
MHSDVRRVEALVRAGRLRAARRLAAETCRAHPRSAAAHNGLGFVDERLGRHAAAASSYERALAIAPADDRLHFNLGNARVLMGKLDEAETAFARALALNPRAVDVLNNLGIIRQYQRRPADAARFYRRAIAIDSRFPVARANLANLAREARRFPAAIAAFRRVLRRFPDYGPAHLGLAVVYLQIADFARGWPEYEWRFWSDMARRRSSPGADWDGSPLAGRSILLRAEQALGDQILFASIVPDVLADAGRVTIECDERLVSLFTRSFAAAEVVAFPYRRWRGRPRSSWPDVRAWLGTLPMYYRRSAATFPAHRGFLVPSSALVARWRRRMRALGPALTVGISWKGGSEPYSRALRSLPIAEWSPLLRTPGVAFVNLQYGPARAEAREVAPIARVHDWPDADPVRDLDGFAAEVAALDLVISIDNTTVHMAGAVGQRVWTLVPYSATWRWAPGRTDNLWFPSMRVFQQRRPGEWGPVLAEIGTELSRLVRERAGRV